MRKSDKFVSALILGLPAPVILALLLWWGSIPLSVNIESIFPLLILTGVTAGVILNLTVLRRFMFSLYKLPLWALFIIEGFYAVMAYGFFMGFPVPCSLAGILGSYIVLRRGIVRGSSRSGLKTDSKAINIFSFMLLFVLCFFTALLSLNEATITSQLKNMLCLSFNVEMWMIWLLIFAGGAFLLTFQYVTSKLIEHSVLKKAGTLI